MGTICFTTIEEFPIDGKSKFAVDVTPLFSPFFLFSTTDIGDTDLGESVVVLLPDLYERAKLDDPISYVPLSSGCDVVSENGYFKTSGKKLKTWADDNGFFTKNT